MKNETDSSVDFSRVLHTAQTVTFDPEERDEDGTHPAAMTVRSKKGRQIDVLKTAARQTRWNRWAAVAAALAALTNAWALRIA